MNEKAPRNEPYTVKFVRMEETLKHMIEQIREIKTLLQKHIDSEKELKEEFEKKFAAKWVESAMKFVIGAFTLGLIGGILKVILL